MSTLEDYRKEIDAIDKEIARLFEKRMRIVAKISEYKRINNIATFDPNREAKMLERNQNYINDELLKKYYVEYLQKQLELSKRYQEERIKRK